MTIDQVQSFARMIFVRMFDEHHTVVCDGRNRRMYSRHLWATTPYLVWFEAELTTDQIPACEPKQIM